MNQRQKTRLNVIETGVKMLDPFGCRYLGNISARVLTNCSHNTRRDELR